MHDDGRFSSSVGLEPADLDAHTPVSVNLWGFKASIWSVLEEAVTAAHPGVAPDGSVRDSGGVHEENEVLLPEVIGDMIRSGSSSHDPARSVKVLEGPGMCLGVTHADDLPVVRNELASMIGQGVRPESLWGSLR